MLGALARGLFGTANDRFVKGLDKPVEDFHRVTTAEVGDFNLKSLIRLLEKLRHSLQKSK